MNPAPPVTSIFDIVIDFRRLQSELSLLTVRLCESIERLVRQVVHATVIETVRSDVTGVIKTKKSIASVNELIIVGVRAPLRELPTRHSELSDTVHVNLSRKTEPAPK